jgi:hypothetical protein
MLVALVTQCVYAWRIWILSHTIWVPIVVTAVRSLLDMIGWLLTTSSYLLIARLFPRQCGELGWCTLMQDGKVLHPK